MYEHTPIEAHHQLSHQRTRASLHAFIYYMYSLDDKV